MRTREEIENTPFQDLMNSVLPLPVGAAMLGTCWLNIHNADPDHKWGMTVNCPWVLQRAGETVLDDSDYGDTDETAPLEWLIGHTLLSVSASDGDGANPLFVFTGDVTLQLYTDRKYDGYEAYVFHPPSDFTVVY